MSWNTGHVFGFKQKEIGRGGLSSLDPGGEYRLLTDICVNEEVEIGKQRGEPVEPPERLIGLLQQNLKAVQIEFRHGRERRGNISAHAFAARFRNHVFANTRAGAFDHAAKGSFNFSRRN